MKCFEVRVLWRRDLHGDVVVSVGGKDVKVPKLLLFVLEFKLLQRGTNASTF